MSTGKLNVFISLIRVFLHLNTAQESKRKDALLTPQEAILEALNNRKTMRGAFQDKLVKIEAELKALESLSQEYNQPLESDQRK